MKLTKDVWPARLSQEKVVVRDMLLIELKQPTAEKEFAKCRNLFELCENSERRSVESWSEEL